MALLSTSVGINDIIGSVGSIVFYKQKNVQCLRATSSVRVQNKLWAVRDRSDFRFFSKLWQSIREVDRIAYNRCATYYNAGKVPYNRRHHSGFSLFMMCNLNLTSIGVPNFLGYPELDRSNIGVVENLTFINLLSDIYFGFTGPSSALWEVQIKSSNYLTLGQNWNVAYVNVFHCPCVPAVIQPILSFITARLGPGPGYDFKLNFRVRIIDKYTGQCGLSLPFKFTFIH